jgi:hypothetical protein
MGEFAPSPLIALPEAARGNVAEGRVRGSEPPLAEGLDDGIGLAGAGPEAASARGHDLAPEDQHSDAESAEVADQAPDLNPLAENTCDSAPFLPNEANRPESVGRGVWTVECEKLQNEPTVDRPRPAAVFRDPR